jgi:hypothetical protein
MAGAGIALPGHVGYEEFCGLFYLRHQIQHERRKEMAAAITMALGSYK